MKRILYAILGLVVLLLVFLAGAWSNRNADTNSRGLYETEYPGVDPAGGEDAFALLTMPAGTVRIPADRQQLIGIKTATVRNAPVVRTLRYLGRVEADETMVYRVNAATDGWIDETFDNSVGTLVQKGDVLATFSTPEMADTMQNFFYAIETSERLAKNKAQTVFRSAEVASYTDDRFILQRQIDLLRGLGVEQSQIDEIRENRKISLTVRISSPATGFVTTRKVSHDEHFVKGDELFRIENLDRVWILADVYENEANYFQPGTEVIAMLPDGRGTYHATVSAVLPVFDTVTRTLKVRLETDNPDYLLRPDMFVDLELPVTLPSSVTVPADAVLYSGTRKTVFVSAGDGYFEPREVETGWRIGDRAQIVRGLSPGEEIVVGGNFFVNSESRLQAAAQGIYGNASQDPICGMNVDENRAAASGYTSEYRGRTYYFCSAGCKSAFDADPSRYLDTGGATPDEAPMGQMTMPGDASTGEVND